MLSIGKLDQDDRADWESLFRGYIDFYQRSEPQQMYDRAWDAFQADQTMHALGAKLDGRLVGITHFLVACQHVIAGRVLPAGPVHCSGRARAGRRPGTDRGGRRRARERRCDRVYWSTQESNSTARRLYDQLAENRGFILYRMQL